MERKTVARCRWPGYSIRVCRVSAAGCERVPRGVDRVFPVEKAHKIGLLRRDARPFPTTVEDTRSPKLHTSESAGISLGETVTSRSMA